MSYFQKNAWWDTKYKIRRPIILEPNSFEVGRESLCAIKINPKNNINKIKEDYSDLTIIFQKEDESFVEVPYYILEESETVVSIVFRPIEKIIQTTTYYLYYSAKTETKLNDSEQRLDQNILMLDDTGQKAKDSLLLNEQARAEDLLSFIGVGTDLDQGTFVPDGSLPGSIWSGPDGFTFVINDLGEIEVDENGRPLIYEDIQGNLVQIDGQFLKIDGDLVEMD